jgi:hypothetical protein
MVLVSRISTSAEEILRAQTSNHPRDASRRNGTPMKGRRVQHMNYRPVDLTSGKRCSRRVSTTSFVVKY